MSSQIHLAFLWFKSVSKDQARAKTFKNFIEQRWPGSDAGGGIYFMIHFGSVLLPVNFGNQLSLLNKACN